MTNFARFTALGLEVQITELDITTDNDPSVNRTEAETLAYQAELYGNVLSACLQVTRGRGAADGESLTPARPPARCPSARHF